MKYIITEDQQKRMLGLISQFLKLKFENSSVVCEINVIPADEEEKDYEIQKGMKYEIFVAINKLIYNYAIGVGIISKISNYLSNWFGLKENEYSINIFVKDC